MKINFTVSLTKDEYSMIKYLAKKKTISDYMSDMIKSQITKRYNNTNRKDK